MAESPSVDQLISLIGHDLSNPLATITGYADLLLEGYWGPLTAAQAEQVALIRASAQRAAALLGALLDASRLAQGWPLLQTDPADLRSLVAEAIDQTNSYLSDRQQTLEVSEWPALPLLRVDRRRLTMAIHLLLRAATRDAPIGTAFTLACEWISPSANAVAIILRAPPAPPMSSPDAPTGSSGQLYAPTLFISEAIVQAHGGKLTWMGAHCCEVLRLELPIIPETHEPD